MTDEWVVVPEVALTVTLNVPGGVPVNVCGLEPPPHEIANVSASTASTPEIARTVPFLRRTEPPIKISPTKPKPDIAARVAPPFGCVEATVLAVVEMVSVVLVVEPLAVSVGGLNPQLAATGSPEQAKLTVPAKPPCGVMLMVNVAA